MEEDVVVVGAGSAGCVVAARLSADPARRVTLIEAGPDYPDPDSRPADLRSGTAMPTSHDWGYTDGELTTFGGSPLPLPRGRVAGGSSSVNYCLALRSRPADHHSWAALGLPEWSWEEILPHYRRLEDDPEGDRRWHGVAGPVPLRRPAPGELTPSQEAFLTACEHEGHKRVTDHNAPQALGAGAAPLNQVDGVRFGATLSHLDPARHRANLRVRSDAVVHSVVLEDGRARGVRLASGEVIRARHVVLCAGSYSSPAVLLRSGIGPREHLRSVGVEPVLDLPGVGSGLVEHPAYLTLFAAAPGDHPPARWRTMLTLRSTPGEPDADLHIQARAAAPSPGSRPHPTGFDIAFVSALVQPLSSGSVRLRSPEAADAPLIELGFYRRAEDARKVAEGVRVIRALAAAPGLRDMLVQEIRPGPKVADADLEDAVRAAPMVYNHPVGSCRMGTDADPQAVVDSRCRVRGTEGLWVIDASVMPVSPRATTHLPVMALADRAVTLNWPVPA
ncbi:FAD-dependent oxidoreductase [Streptomyces sp. NPDC047000]|uniref:GMC family oxidoreductase n=1 Tax=Streptomyces sp. NPDC047000 TaxID=3155474 RepID=UPI0033F7B10A